MSQERDPQAEERGFKVEDRRRFTSSGEPRSGGEEQHVERGGGQTASEQFRMSAPPPEPEISFSTFVISLGTQALVQLGEIPDPLSREVHTDLVSAQQTIDILGMLEQKTRGNLDADEAELLRRLLFDLRLRYAEKARQ